MKKSSLGILVIGAVILGFIVWYSLAQKSGSTSEESLRIVSNVWVGNGVFYVAQEKGFFDQEGVKVEFTTVDDSAAGKQLLQSGRVDAYYLTPETVAILHDAGVDVKVFAANDLSFGADGVIATKDIETISDLKGKVVAFEVGSPSHFLLSYLLNQVGMTTNDFTVINNVASDAGAAFVGGKVDAAVTWEPWLSQATQREGGHVLASSKEAPVVFDMLIFRSDSAEARQQDIKAMFRALFAAQEWIEANQSETADILAEQLHITSQEAADQMSGVHWLSYKENVDKLTSGNLSVQSSIQIAADLWLKLGLIQNKVEASKIVDDSILKDLYK